MQRHTTTTLIACCGNALRGDDAFGLRVFSALHARFRSSPPDGVELRALSTDGFDLLYAFENCQRVIIVDALNAPGPIGTRLRLDASDHPLQTGLLGTSTHALGVAGAIELARTLGQLPPHVTMVGVIGGRFSVGSTMNEQVAAAIPRVVALVEAELSRHTRGPNHTEGDAAQTHG